MAKLNTSGRASGTGPFATEATSSGKTHESGKGPPVPPRASFPVRDHYVRGEPSILRSYDISR